MKILLIILLSSFFVAFMMKNSIRVIIMNLIVALIWMLNAISIAQAEAQLHLIMIPLFLFLMHLVFIKQQISLNKNELIDWINK